PLDLMIGSWKGFSGARSAYQRLQELLRNHYSERSSMPLPPPKGELSVEGIFVMPPGSNQLVLRGVGFSLNSGDMLAIVGPSAPGRDALLLRVVGFSLHSGDLLAIVGPSAPAKSSLVRGLLGVWTGNCGKVRLDGAGIHQWDKFRLGPRIGYLPEVIELFEGT